MGVIFNEDPNHFVYTRAQAGVTELSEKDLTDFIDGYSKTNITDFLICVNASLPHFRTKKIESVCDKYRAWEKSGKLCGRENDPIIKSSRLLCETLEKGISLFANKPEEMGWTLKEEVPYENNAVRKTYQKTLQYA